MRVWNKSTNKHILIIINTWKLRVCKINHNMYWIFTHLSSQEIFIFTMYPLLFCKMNNLFIHSIKNMFSIYLLLSYSREDTEPKNVQSIEIDTLVLKLSFKKKKWWDIWKIYRRRWSYCAYRSQEKKDLGYLQCIIKEEQKI